MSRTDLSDHLVWAKHYTGLAVQQLVLLRAVYLRDRELPRYVRDARIAAINSKIATLDAVTLNPGAHPWAVDWAPTPPPTIDLESR